MYEKILVPLDGSKLAEASLPYASELARKLGSQITLLSVLPSDSESEEDRYHRLHRLYIQEIARTMKERAIKVKSVIVTGEPAEQIIDYADKKKTDLIIMGTHGRSALKRWVLGSVADKVVSAVTCPVALVSLEDDEEDIQKRKILRKALVILDGREESEVVIPYVEELASRFKMEVTLLQLVEQAYEYYLGTEDLSHTPVSREKMNSIKAKVRRHLKKLADPLESKGITIAVKVMVGNSADAIIEIAGKIDADLLATATRGRAGISRWFFRSVRDDIVNIGNTLVLLVRAPE